MLGPSARALLRAFGPRPQTPRPSASDLRPSKLFCLASSDGWKSRAFGPRKSVAFQRWMDARAFGPRTAGLRPAVWGPSAPKPLTHKISTFCNFVQNGQKIPRPSASVCSGLRPSLGGPPARRLGAFGPQTSHTQNFDLLYLCTKWSENSSAFGLGVLGPWPSLGGPPARRLGAFGPQTTHIQNFDLL